MRAMCGVHLKDGKGADEMLFVLGLNETLDWLATANSINWYGRALRREDGHVLRREDVHVLRR